MSLTTFASIAVMAGAITLLAHDECSLRFHFGVVSVEDDITDAPSISITISALHQRDHWVLRTCITILGAMKNIWRRTSVRR